MRYVFYSGRGLPEQYLSGAHFTGARSWTAFPSPSLSLHPTLWEALSTAGGSYLAVYEPLGSGRYHRLSVHNVVAPLTGFLYEYGSYLQEHYAPDDYARLEPLREQACLPEERQRLWNHASPPAHLWEPLDQVAMPLGRRYLACYMMYQGLHRDISMSLRVAHIVGTLLDYLQTPASAVGERLLKGFLEPPF
jgi:hypothetical protein